MYDEVLAKLKTAYKQVINRIGDALEDNVLIGPLHSQTSVDNYKMTIDLIRKEGGTIELGGKVSRMFYSRKYLLRKIKLIFFLDTRSTRILCRTHNHNWYQS